MCVIEELFFSPRGFSFWLPIVKTSSYKIEELQGEGEIREI